VSAEGRVVPAERLGPAFDLIAEYEPAGVFFERAGIGVAASASGSAFGFPLEARRGAPDIARMLDEVFAGLDEEEREPGAPSPILFVSVPFDRRREAIAIRPASVVRRDRPGETWRISVAANDRRSEARTSKRFVGAAVPHHAFTGMQLHPHPDPGAYERTVAEAVRRIERGELRKVVLARTLEVAAGRRLDPKQLLWRLRAVDPDGFAFAFPFGGPHPRVLVGATPELLVERSGSRVRADPLAGSAPRSGDPGEDRASGERLLASDKDREEHSVVVEDVGERLGPFCSSLDHDPEPVLLGTANVWHLCTRFRGTLREPASDALSLALALHPTAAIGGMPRDRALEAIRQLEPFQRGGYAGPVGWVDAAGDGVFAIALRCAELRGDIATLYAGAGIVAGSVPELELDETERKFRAFLDSLRWG
jgi:isochorismate synthase